MDRPQVMDNEQLANLIRRSLKHSRRVEIDGLGVFERGDTGRVSFRERSGCASSLPMRRRISPPPRAFLMNCAAEGMRRGWIGESSCPGRTGRDASKTPSPAPIFSLRASLRIQ
jgi:hypothetical protein